MTDDDYDEVSADELPTFRLFFSNKECDECPMHLYDFKSEEWDPTRLRPKSGDHVVMDGTEMVCLGGNSYRELGKHEEPVWDFSEPEAAKIEAIQYHDQLGFPERIKLDRYVDPTSLIGQIRRW